MKDKKIFAYKNEQVRKIAFNLRSLIRKAVMQEWSRLGKEQKDKPTLEYIKVGDERSYLYRALKASICLCPGCHQTDKEMVYNAPLKHWFCTQCAQEYRDLSRIKQLLTKVGSLAILTKISTILFCN